MDIRQLEHFVAVAEERHFTRAAARCHLSQSALSASIRALEKEMDAVLFERTTRHVELTLAGEALRAEAANILASFESAREAINATEGRLGGSLSVGGVLTGELFDQAELLARFHALHPEVRLQYVGGNSPDLLEDLRTGRLDLAFLSVPRSMPAGFEVRQLTSRPMTLICRRDHPLADRDAVELEMLADDDIIGGPPRSVMNALVKHVLDALGHDGDVRFQVFDPRAMVDFVEHGLGVALLPSYLVRDRQELVAVPLADPRMVWTIGVATAVRDKASRATHALLDLIDTAFPPKG